MAIREKEVKLSPVIKYPGGKEKELKYILPNLPENCRRYFEPFIGGGAVYFSLDAEAYYINDKSTELIHLYTMIQSQNQDFLEKLTAIDNSWTVLEQLADRYMEELVNLYFEFKNHGLDVAGLNDAVSTFVLKNAEEFNGLLREKIQIAISNFVIEND